MFFLRALIFQIVFYTWSTLVCGLGTLAVLTPGRGTAIIVETFWSRSVQWLLKYIVGLKVEFRGRENLGKGPLILAVKHQSAWDTIVFASIVHDPIFVFKRSLLAIPFYGWFLYKLGMIGVDRDAGGSALKEMVRQARKMMARGCRYILIFPEGTRSPPGAPPDYLPGVAGMYSMLKIPVVPVALNSGLFWARRRFVIFPGTITLEFLPPIPPGLSRDVFMGELQGGIEAKTAALLDEGRERFPYLP
ncbi:MAG: 1-acyl-sn-glycerol-3-phosphate acyltransferase [Rhodospirillaceae bacterium]|jgi:1-acyl-sn-glycerol-3-phosphate acyltransferase|nr:1-acyl-sn-glycerol-3-phosphate acyltransferase [Rhodospirillaceae bacterium]MBT5752266.1 1-acyl-sn-glycerol-3-phosphate acyltransferase [Rhodospirillaceae bacterium]